MSIERRRFLKLAAGGVAVGGLGGVAGCSSSCPDSDAPTPDRIVSIRDPPVGPFEVSSADPWSTSHGNPSRTGFTTGSLPESNIGIRWRRSLEIPSTDQGSLSTSAPAISRNKVFIADSERVHAISLRTGEREWRSDLLPITVHDTIFEYQANTVTPTIGPKGNALIGTMEGVTALDRADGSVQWAIDGMETVASPAVIGNRIVAQGASELSVIDGSGDVVWRRQIDRGDEPVPPAAGSDHFIVTTADGLRGFDPSTGDERWTSDIPVETYPVIDSGTCFIGNSEGLHAIDVATGKGRWTFSRGGYRAFLSPVTTPDTIYVVEQPGEAGAASFALDRTNGEPNPRWCSYIGSGVVSAATDEMALAIVPVGEGPEAVQAIVAFSKSLGQAHWALKGGSSPRDWVTPPAVIDGGLVATTRGGTTVALGEVDPNA